MLCCLRQSRIDSMNWLTRGTALFLPPATESVVPRVPQRPSRAATQWQDAQLPPRLTLMPVRQPPPDGETRRKTTMKLAPHQAPRLASELISQTRKGSTIRKAERPHDNARTTRRGRPSGAARVFSLCVCGAHEAAVWWPPAS